MHTSENGDQVNEKFFIRTQSDFAGMYGVGEFVSPGVALFRTGEFDLTREEAEALLARKQKAVK